MSPIKVGDQIRGTILPKSRTRKILLSRILGILCLERLKLRQRKLHIRRCCSA